ncbi:glutamate--tRNA ligase [soil metagenome]
MHIGTARTALFNQLFARHHGGRFLLRVEDTDRERSTAAAVDVIFDGMKWLGLEFDGEPVFQAQRAPLHAAAAHAMLETGGAYRDYTTAEELEAERAAARAEGRVVRSAWRDRSPDEAPADAPFAVRLKAPLEGETVVHDLVKGDVTFKNADLDDLVILRSDGTPTYNLAVVVDDHDMGVTHVIRGDDHLNNAARQTLIYQALGWNVPAFAHIPLIHGPDGAKLSKRHGAQAVGEFRDMGYLPEAMRNYLARLGWGHGDDELFTDAQAAEWFDVADVVKAPARLDWDKLNFVNQQYIRAADDQRLAALVTTVRQIKGLPTPASAQPRLETAISLVKEAAQTTLQLADLVEFALAQRPLTLNEKSASLLTDETRARLGRLRDKLAGHGEWTVEALNGVIRAFAAEEGVGVGKFCAALRGVLSGGLAAPDLASALAILGRDESLGRLGDVL